MKRNKEIELNGKQYVLELNRESFAQIDKICNIRKMYAEFSKEPYEYIDEIDDNYNPMEDVPNLEEIQKQAEQKVINVKKLYERAFFIWLYPNHQLKLKEVQEILKPYFEDYEKFIELDNLFIETMNDCVSVRDNKNIDSKN